MSIVAEAVGRLEREMDARGWSQNRMARELGYDPKTINRWCRRVTSPDEPWSRDLLRRLDELTDKEAVS